ncbi:MAG TPA: S66 peptidase family protein [Pilimelia sp.]|nr:S66 peptidase family protein [Pilimelia sp.]
MSTPTSSLLRPRVLAPGDVVAVAGLSNSLGEHDRAGLDRGVAVLAEMGFEVRVAPLVDPRRRRWWAAGTPQEQADELNALLRDPQVRAIVPHTGGNSVFAYLDLIDFDAVVADPKIVLGYSDISLLLLALHARTGLVGLHGDGVTHGLGGDWFVRAVEGQRAQLTDLYTRVLTRAEPLGALPAARPWECWRPGQASGPLVGGLISRLQRIQATPYALAPECFDGAILFWEDVGRPLHWVWNDLHALRLAGVLDRIAGMLVGVPHDLQAVNGDSPPELREVVLDVLGDRRLPVLGQVEFGHAGPNLPLPLGVRAELDAEARTVALVEAAFAPG